MYSSRNLTKFHQPTDLNVLISPKGRSNSLFHYRPVANQEYSSRISLDPEGEKKLQLRYQKYPGHIFNVLTKTNFLEESKSLRADERADLQSEMNSHLKKQKYQILLEKDSFINNICRRTNSQIRTEFNEHKMKLKNKLIQIIRETLIFAKNNSPVGAMLHSNVHEFLEKFKTEPDNSLNSLSLESIKENNEKTKLTNKKKIKKKQKNEFLRLIGVDVENLSINNINLDIDKAWNYIVKLGNGRNVEDILRMKVVNSIMSLTEQSAALKVKHINQKYDKYKSIKDNEKKEKLRLKREEEEKRLEELRQMNPRDIIKEKIKASLGQKSDIRKYSHSMNLMNKKREKEYKDNKIKKRIELDSYKDIDQILDIIENSKKESKSRFFLQHYINIRRKKSFDLAMEKAMEKNKVVDENK